MADTRTDEAISMALLALGDMLTFLMAENSKSSVQSVDLKQSLLDAILELDNSNHSSVLSIETPTEAEDKKAFSSGILPSLQRTGKLQRIQKLRLSLFGGAFKDDKGKVITIPGIFDELLNMSEEEID